MSEDLAISDVRFTPASRHLLATGLLGHVRVRYGKLRVGGIAVRRTLDHRLVISFPARRTRGIAHAIVRPLDADARSALEAAILAELDAQGALP